MSLSLKRFASLLAFVIALSPLTALAQDNMVTKSLVLFFNSSRVDNFTSTSAKGIQAAFGSKYRSVRLEGAIFAAQESGTVPLKLYWSAKRTDNFSTATAKV